MSCAHTIRQYGCVTHTDTQTHTHSLERHTETVFRRFACDCMCTTFTFLSLAHRIAVCVCVCVREHVSAITIYSAEGDCCIATASSRYATRKRFAAAAAAQKWKHQMIQSHSSSSFDRWFFVVFGKLSSSFSTFVAMNY